MCSHLPNHLIILSSTDRQGKNILIKLLLGTLKSSKTIIYNCKIPEKELKIIDF